MFTKRKNAASNKSEQASFFAKMLRLAAIAVSLSFSLLAIGCGGGGDARLSENFNISVTIGGQLLSVTPIAPGGSYDVTVHAGQSVSFDAGESVVWTLYVGGNAVNVGTQVFYADTSIITTPISQTAILLDTYARYPLSVSAPITLVATSTYDSYQVATINVLITN